MSKIDELQKAIDEAAMAGVLMIRKSQMSLDFTAPNPHHVAYTRTNASGTVSNIAAKGAPTGYEYHKKKAAEASAKAVDSASHTAAASAHMEAILQAGHGSKEASFHEEAYKHHMKMATALPAAKVSNIQAKGTPKVEIKRVSSNEQNVSQRHVSYDLHVDGKYHSTHNDINDAMDHKERIEKQSSQPAAKEVKPNAKQDEANKKTINANEATRFARTWMDHKKAAEKHYEAADAWDEAGNDTKYNEHIQQAEKHEDKVQELK